ncbi:hypothetical protein Vadar_008156 [Vaccinium darrowii]|uniref:Uncharacterized protein n=1 Tax=Vaccinium darrowii TaxID=229202 RepID=A0ACB7YTY0_9ERIC|nr:hypothetical protein Vadar_008156 [Vaccinium darrowii]
MYATRCVRDDNVPCQIEEGLYLGSVGAANNKSELKRLNITHILTVANSLPPTHPNDFVYKIINIPDREDVNIENYFDECFTFIDEAKRTGGGVLVHCFVGKSRSVTVVVAYLMKKHGMSVYRTLRNHFEGQTTPEGPQSSPVASSNSGSLSQEQRWGGLWKFSSEAILYGTKLSRKGYNILLLGLDIKKSGDVREAVAHSSRMIEGTYPGFSCLGKGLN